MSAINKKLKIFDVPIEALLLAEYNPRTWSEKADANLTTSIKHYGIVDPIIVNGTANRKNVVIGGHFRLHVARQLSINTVPVVYVDLPSVEREKELNLRLNRNTVDFYYMLAFNTYGRKGERWLQFNTVFNGTNYISRILTVIV